jgi:multiple sugar transport system ATP-binding protein
MRTELEQLHRTLKTTTIYVTHDQVEAMTLGDHVAVMKAGIIHQYDSPQETYDRPTNRFVAGFIGSPAMNFLQAHTASLGNGQIKLTGKEFILLLSEERISKPLPKEVIIGIRPEHLDGPVSAGENTVAVRVRVTETLGHELLVYADCGDERIVANLNPHRKIDVDTTIHLKVDMESLHLFDQDTERTLL